MDLTPMSPCNPWDDGPDPMSRPDPMTRMTRSAPRFLGRGTCPHVSPCLRGF